MGPKFDQNGTALGYLILCCAALRGIYTYKFYTKKSCAMRHSAGQHIHVHLVELARKFDNILEHESGTSIWIVS
jgi:hypothetical protein